MNKMNLIDSHNMFHLDLNQILLKLLSVLKVGHNHTVKTLQLIPLFVLC